MAITKQTVNVRFHGPADQPDMPYLLTPGPLTTSPGVKQAMLADWGSRDVEFRRLIKGLGRQLLQIAGAGDGFECVLMQGAGTFAIEAALASFCPGGRKLKTLVVVNGAYGHRAAAILDRLKRPNTKLVFDEEKPVEPSDVEAALNADDDISVVFVVHCETTTGVINPLAEIADICKRHGKIVYVDAMSSFGALDIDMERDKIDILVSSANKCIEGAPGFAYVLCQRDLLEASEGKSHSVALDLYDQWRALQKTEQFRFTPPTHVLVAFDQALREHKQQGGVRARGAQYAENTRHLLAGMRKLGFQTLLEDKDAGPIIQTFLSPGDPRFDFEVFYEKLRQHGFAIYPGKLTKRDSFRIGTIGRIDVSVISRLVTTIEAVLKEMGVASAAPADQ